MSGHVSKATHLKLCLEDYKTFITIIMRKIRPEIICKQAQASANIAIADTLEQIESLTRQRNTAVHKPNSKKNSLEDCFGQPRNDFACPGFSQCIIS